MSTVKQQQKLPAKTLISLDRDLDVFEKSDPVKNRRDPQRV
jgi:hypothetical protein